jgi:ribosomal protein L40E
MFFAVTVTSAICPAGTYSDDASVCQNCTADTTSDVGATVCRPCNDGYHTLGDGSPTCKGCPRHYADRQDEPQDEWSWSENGCVIKCEDWFVYENYRTNEYGYDSWGCIWKPFEYSRLWGTPTLPEHGPVPWRAEDIPGILERNPSWNLTSWNLKLLLMTAAPTTSVTPPPSTQEPTIPPTTPITSSTMSATTTPTPTEPLWSFPVPTPTEPLWSFPVWQTVVGGCVGVGIILLVYFLIRKYCVHGPEWVHVRNSEAALKKPLIFEHVRIEL